MLQVTQIKNQQPQPIQAKASVSWTKMQLIATGLLFFMFLVFIAAKLGELTYPWLKFVRAFAEAAMVGALADWFAVVALFRHPLNLKIPHTAIIPNNRDRIGENLGRFVNEHFLTPEVLEEKLQSIDIAGKITEWLKNPTNSARIADEVCDFIPQALKALDDEDVQRFIRDSIWSQIREIRVTPLVGHILEILTVNGRHQEVLDGALKLALRLLDTSRNHILKEIDEQRPWYFPKFLGHRLYEKIRNGTKDAVDKITADPNHELRRKFHEATQEFIEKLKTHPDFIARGEVLKEEIFHDPSVQRYFLCLWHDVKMMILRDAVNPDSLIRVQIRKGLASLAESLHQDLALREKINDWARRSLLATINHHRAGIANLIPETVRRWSATDLSIRVERAVGDDLQYIRINGTVIGGLAGLLIYLLSLLIT